MKDNRELYATIGVVGNGFVGNAIVRAFRGQTEGTAYVRVYDKDETRSENELHDVIGSDYVFVCLPTPMKSADGADCDLSILEDFFDNLPQKKAPVLPREHYSQRSPSMKESSEDRPLQFWEDDVTIYIVKSTVPVGTVEALSKKHPHLSIVHSPEFLTARNALHDFVNADRHVVGGNEHLCNAVVALYEDFFPNVPTVKMSSNESECVKYFANCFLATKVVLFNEMRLLCDNLGMGDDEWERIVDAVAEDSRIGVSHTTVPGPDGQRGFGGGCFPKDLNALIHTMQKNGVNPLILKSVWEQNKELRENWDWSNMESAVSSE